jgi:DNA-binding LytR/AlgR family response regulator
MKRKILISSNNENGKNALEVKEFREIIYMKSFEGKTKTYCCEGKENLIKKSLSQIEEKLPKEKFFKIHKSIIINIDYIKGINANAQRTVTLQDGIELQVAQRKYKDFMEFLKTNFEIWF